METQRKNPWLGLESYREGEILYGRDDDIRDLSQCVLNDTDTLLYGKSGIGKSSILNAGILPAARRFGYLPVLVRLSHKESHSYLYQIKEAIANAMIPVPTDESGVSVVLTSEEQEIRNAALSKRIKEVVGCKNQEIESLYEFFHRHTFHDAAGQRIKLLIIFDQFEEIFTLQSDESRKKRFFAELADFLNDIMPGYLQGEVVTEARQDEGVQLVDTGDLDDLFSDLDLDIKTKLPEYVKDNEIHLVFTIREDFLSEFEYYSAPIPSLKQNRYGLRPINEEQAAQIILRPRPGLIDKTVAKLIIEKVTGRTDFELDGVPEIEVDSAVLSLYLNRLYEAKKGDTITAELVEQKGGEIIGGFYNDAISSISDSTIAYLEDMLLNGQGRRDNITIFDAINDGGATEEELDILCNKKKILRQFNYAGDLRIEYVHDILCPVVKAHKKERKLLRQQEAERLRQESEKQKLLKAEEAKREKIRKDAEEEKARLREEAIKIRQRNRRRLTVIGVCLLVAALGAAIYVWYYKWEFKASYAAYTTMNGWPVGIGKTLDESDKEEMPVYYQLVRYGYRSRNTRVNVLDCHKDPTHNKFSESPLVSLYETEGEDDKAKDFASLQRQTAFWIFTPDNDGNLLRKTAYDIKGRELYGVQYFRSAAVSVDKDTEQSHINQLWANYVDRYGKSMSVRDNGADRIRVIVNDSTGYFEGYQFYSETGTPQPNNVGAYGYRYRLGSDGRILKKTPVDAFGDLMNERTIEYLTFDDFGRWTSQAQGLAEYGNRQVVFAMKERTDSLIFGVHGELLYHSETGVTGESRQFHYDHGQVSKTCHYKPTGMGVALVYSREVLPQDKPDVKETVDFCADSLVQYRMKREETSLNSSTVAYYGGDAPDSIRRPIEVSMAPGLCHKVVSDTLIEHGVTKVTKIFLDESDRPSARCRYNRDVAYYNANHEMLKHIVYKDNQRVFAYLYEYEAGQIVAQSVLGVDEADYDIVRYPMWDRYHLCYYKMKLVYNFTNTLVAVKGVNEFGEESLITTEDLENYKVDVLPPNEISATEGDIDLYGVQIYKVQTQPINQNLKVEYIHIQDKQGTWYQAGIRDGDLLVSDAEVITIARPVPNENTYEIKKIAVSTGETGAEHYAVYFTQNEMNRYKNALTK